MRRIQAQISAGPSQRFARFTLLAGKLLIAFLTVALWPPVAAAQYCDWNCSDYSGSGNDNFTPYDPYANYSVPTSGSTPSPPPPDLPFTPEFNPTLPASFSPGTTPSDQEMSTVRGTLAFNDSVATRPLSTSASEQNATDPVRDGELIAQVTDVSLPGSIPFEFRRTYRSRTRHLGVLGYGWDHSYNKRIIAADDCGDVDLMTGDSGRVRFSVGKVTPDSVTYSAPSGVPLFLRKTGTSADTTAWDLYDGSALRYHFNQYGLLSNIYDKQGHTLSVVWEVTDRTLRYKDQNGNDQVTVYPVLLGSDLMWRVQYIKDTTGRHIYFNYLHGYGNDPGWFLQCLSISPDCSQPLVSYEYSPVDPLTPPDDPDYGNLVKVVRPDGTGFAYSYYDTCTRANGLTCTSSGYLADDDADAYCANACGTTADCHSASLCGRASPDCKAYLSGIKQTGGNPEEACTDSLLSFEQCMQQYVNHSVPNHNNPLCEYTRDTGSSCAQACMSDVMAHGQWSCGIIEPQTENTLPFWAWEQYCSGGFDGFPSKQDLANSYCSQLCWAEALCIGTIDDLCTVINDNSIPFCQQGQASCESSCRDRYHHRDASGQYQFAYGQPEDLYHNLLEIHDLSGRLLQHNEYGTEPTDPSFDKVLIQQLGDGTNADNRVSFYYVDYVHDAWTGVRPVSFLAVFDFLLQLPDTISTLADTLTSTSLSLSDVVSTVDRISASALDPLARYVDFFSSFKPVYVCPATCEKAKQSPSIPNIPYSPPPIVRLPATVTGSSPIVVVPLEGNKVQLLAPSPGAAVGTVSLASLLPVIHPDGFIAELSTSGTASAGTAIEDLAVSSPQIRFEYESDRKPGYYKLKGDEAAIKLLTKAPTPTPLVLTNEILRFPSVSFAPEPPDLNTRESCDEWTYSGPWVGSAPAEPQSPDHAVVVADLHGVARTEYYDSRGRVLREINHHTTDQHPKEVTDYNYDPISGAIQGIQYTDGRRSCRETDWLGRPTQFTELPAPGAPGGAQAATTIYRYGIAAYPWGVSSNAPPLSDIVSDPDSPSPAITHFDRDSWQRVLSEQMSVDATHSVTTSFTYDPAPSAGPRTITSPQGALTTLDNYTPTGPGLVTRDANGADPVQLRITYDVYGRPSEIRRQNHVRAVRITADENGIPSLVSVASPSGIFLNTQYSGYDVNHQPAQIDLPTSTLTLRYDALGHRFWQVETGKPLVGRDPLPPRTTCWNYSPDGRLEAVLEPEGNVTSFSYDDGGRLTQIVKGYPGPLPAWATDCLADLQSHGEPTPLVNTNRSDAEVVETISYDSAGHVVRIADGTGVGETFINDGFGRPIDVIDDAGTHHRRGYDARGRIVWESTYGPNPPAYGEPTALGNGLLTMVEYAYDNLDRVIQTSRWHFAGDQPITPGKLAIVTTITYDETHGQVILQEDGHPPQVSTIDGLGRVIGITLPNGSSESASWEENGTVGDTRTRTVTGPDGKPRTFVESFDDWGRLVERDDSAGTVLLQQDFDGEGRLFRRVIGGSEIAAEEFDQFGRPAGYSEIASSVGRKITYSWDGNDRLIGFKDGNNALTSFGYDGVGRRSNATYPDGSQSTWSYYSGSTRIHVENGQFGTEKGFVYDSVGNLKTEDTTSAFADPIERAFTYTALGQVETATISGAGSGETNGLVVSFGYDSLGNRISETSSNSPISVAHVWDRLGGGPGVTKLTYSGSSQAATITRSYDDLGRLADSEINGQAVVRHFYEAQAGRSSYGGGAIIEQPSFNLRGWQSGVDLTDQNGAPIASVHDRFGADGIIRERQRRFGAGELLTDIYRVDQMGRLTGEILRRSGIPPFSDDSDVSDSEVNDYFNAPTCVPSSDQICVGNGSFNLFQLDSVANWLSKQDSLGTEYATFTSASGLNQYDRFGRDSSGSPDAQWQYAGGNVTSVGADIYQYDALGRLIGSDGLRFSYDALGRRRIEDNPEAGTSTELVWDGDNVIAYGAPGDPSNYTIRIGGETTDQHSALASAFGTGPLVFLHQLPDGSVFAATASTGLEEGYAYSGYGETAFFNSLGRLNQAALASSIGNRFLFQGQLYDPELRTYAMRLREYRPDVGRFLSPDPIGISGGENLYAFVLGKPLAFGDPFGLSPVHGSFSTVTGPRDASEALAWQRINQLYVPPGVFNRLFMLSWQQSAYSDSSISRFGWGLAAGTTILPAMAEEMARGILNAPYAFLSGIETFRDAIDAWDSNAAWFNQVDIAARGVSGIAQVTGVVLGTGAMATPIESYPVMDESQVWGPHNGPGPLGEDVAKTFRSATYVETVLSEDTIFYRVYGGKASPTSSYWTRIEPAGPLQSQMDSALLPEYGNTQTNIAVIRVPAGTTVYEGAAGPQVGRGGLPSLLGGGNQVYIPVVDPSWLVITR